MHCLTSSSNERWTEDGTKHKGVVFHCRNSVRDHLAVLNKKYIYTKITLSYLQCAYFIFYYFKNSCKKVKIKKLKVQKKVNVDDQSFWQTHLFVLAITFYYYTACCKWLAHTLFLYCDHNVGLFQTYLIKKYMIDLSK